MMKNLTGNWLLTFSDLFFILVAFFLLRHQMIETPKLVSDENMPSEFSTTSVKTPKKIKLARLIDTSIDQPQSQQSYTTLEIPIQYSWFLDQSELNSKGEEAMRGLRWKLKDTKASISLKLYINQQQDSLSSRQRLMLEILVGRLNEIKKLSNINISTKKGDVVSNPGVIEINYN